MYSKLSLNWCLHVAGLYTTAPASFWPHLPKFHSHIQDTVTEDNADLVRKCLRLMKALISPQSHLLVGWCSMSIANAAVAAAEGYLQQRANYANEGTIQWD